MGLFDMFKKKSEPAAPAGPAPVSAQAVPDTLCAPVSGRVIKMSRAAIAEAGHPDCVVLAVSNTAEFADVRLTVDPESTVPAGAAVAKVVR
ncbi:MAG TPA: hypothetical protein H9801_09025 [Candidatus Collinsella stercoripullorum]|nr:hypothetical protein [Candidatus Collinsella stercoripullorum]